MFRIITEIFHFNFTRAWVGLERVPRGSVWKWTNNEIELTNSSRWNVGEPNNDRNLENCAELWRHNARLNDVPCSVSKLALCEKCSIND